MLKNSDPGLLSYIAYVVGSLVVGYTGPLAIMMRTVGSPMIAPTVMLRVALLSMMK